jgi:hypothetical protein
MHDLGTADDSVLIVCGPGLRFVLVCPPSVQLADEGQLLLLCALLQNY